MVILFWLAVAPMIITAGIFRFGKMMGDPNKDSTVTPIDTVVVDGVPDFIEETRTAA